MLALWWPWIPWCRILTNLAEVRPGVQAGSVEQRKHDHRGAACRAAGWKLCPFAVETFGVCGALRLASSRSYLLNALL